MAEIDQALQHHRAGRLREAEGLYRRILDTVPEHADVLHLLGVLNAQTDKHDTAVELIESAIRINPNIPDYYNSLGETLRSQGDLDAAIDAYQRALARQPDYAAAHFNLAIVWQGQGKLTQAIAAYRQALALTPDSAEMHNNLGIALQAQGDLEAAVAAFERARTLDPKLATTCYNLGNVLQVQGRSSAAIAAYRQALDSDPEFAAVHNNLASVLRQQGNADEAMAHCRRALELNPEYVDAHCNLAELLADSADLQAATDCYRKALRLAPENAAAWGGLGSLLRQQHRSAEAIEAFCEALRIRPDYSDAHNDLGLVYTALGDLEAAKACYRKAIESDANHTRAYENLAKINRYDSVDDDEIAHLQVLADSAQLSDASRIPLYFALGKMLDDCGKYDVAFEHYRTANQLKRKTKSYDRDKIVAKTSDVIATFSVDFFKQRRDYDHPSEVPVFIVGMPRSGTTLVEQIIASHPRIFGADELTEVENMTTMLPTRLQTNTAYPACTVLADEDLIRSFAKTYLEKLYAIGGDAERVTDKMPGNYFHLGFIALMFPQARVIHCRRHPLDVCLSIYFRNFGHGHDYAYDLGDIGIYFHQYQRLMQHWQQVLPLKICDIWYEELIANQEAESRRLIDYCGLPWDDHCLEHYKNDRPVQTMSNWQVRQPIYTDSIERWKHYEEYLDELKQRLAEE